MAMSRRNSTVGGPVGPRRRKVRLPRVSLRRLLVLFTIACVALGMGAMLREHVGLLREVERHRQHVGHLKVSDPNKVHAIAVQELTDFTWKWRVFVPADAKIQLFAQFSAIPTVGIPLDSATDIALEPGEAIVTAALRRGIEDQWQFVLDLDMDGPLGRRLRTQRTPLSQQETQWVQSRYAWVNDAPEETQVEQDGEPTVLMRLLAKERTSPRPWRFHATELPFDGLMVWLQRRP